VSEELDHALTLAYRFLSRRERTVFEVRRQLERKGIGATYADRVVAALTEQGYLDDARFARLFVQDKRELEEWGEDRIRRGLRTRGIDPDLISAALANASGSTDAPGETELDRAVGILRHRFPSPPRERRERDRALGVLIRKGYDPELALDALTIYAHGY
jgi:regulatory protein